MRKTWSKEQTLAYIAGRIEINETTGCHEWQGPRTRDGYGQIGPTGIVAAFGIKGVHRLIVHLVHGHEFTSRHEQTMHSCDNRCCCNPDHLSVGTAKQNQTDAWARGLREHLRGETNPSAKLTTRDVITMKELMAFGWRNCFIKLVFPQISIDHISKIRNGKSWAHITI